jgi:hypothetical protein
MNAVVRWAVSLICLAAVHGVHAQTLQDKIAGARLGTGYAQLLNVTATPDVSSAHYDVQENASSEIDVLRLPWESEPWMLTPRTGLSRRVAAARLGMHGNFDVGTSGGISSKWSAYSASAGVVASIKLSDSVTLRPAVDFAVARLSNHADYTGSATALAPVLDGPLFNWSTYARLLTPNVALRWQKPLGDRRLSAEAHVGWSWISSFSESNGLLGFRETAGVYSLRLQHAMPTGLSAFDRSLDWIAFGGYAGFFGPNRDALGFTSIAEMGLGLETMILPSNEKLGKLRVGASYLTGAHVRGWTVSVGLSH